MSLLFFGLLIVGGVLASLRIHGFGRIVLWSAVGFAGSCLFRGARVLVLVFLLVLILEWIYWLALPPEDEQQGS